MAVPTKDYPGDLPPIPPGPDAEAELNRRLIALLEFFNIARVSVSRADVALAVLQKLIEKHKPAEAELLLRLIPHLNEASLDIVLREYIRKFLPGLCIKDKSGVNKGGRPRLKGQDAVEAHRLKSALHVLEKFARAANHPKHRGLTAKLAELLRRYPQLEPKRQLANKRSTSAKSAASKCRTIKREVKQRQSRLDTTFSQRWSEFLSRCNPATKCLIERFCELSEGMKAADESGNHEAKELLKAERNRVFNMIIIGPEYLEEWQKLLDEVASIEPDSEAAEIWERKLGAWEEAPLYPDGIEFVNLFLSAEHCYLLPGMAWLAEQSSSVAIPKQ